MPREFKFDHDVPHKKGFHPEYPHLIYVEADPHHGMYLVTSPAAEGSMLASEDDLAAMEPRLLDEGYAYISDEYLPHFE